MPCGGTFEATQRVAARSRRSKPPLPPRRRSRPRCTRVRARCSSRVTSEKLSLAHRVRIDPSSSIGGRASRLGRASSLDASAAPPASATRRVGQADRPSATTAANEPLGRGAAARRLLPSSIASQASTSASRWSSAVVVAAGAGAGRGRREWAFTAVEARAPRRGRSGASLLLWRWPAGSTAIGWAHRTSSRRCPCACSRLPAVSWVAEHGLEREAQARASSHERAPCVPRHSPHGTQATRMQEHATWLGVY